MNEALKNYEIMRSTLNKIKNEVNRFIEDADYESPNIANIKDNLNNIENEIIENQKKFQVYDKNDKDKDLNKNSISINQTTSTHGKIELPIINSVKEYNTLIYKTRIDKPKSSNEYLLKLKEKVFYKNSMLARRPIDPISDKIKSRKKNTDMNKEVQYLLKKYNIIKDDPKIQRFQGGKKNYEKTSWNKYKTYYKNLIPKVLYDDDDKPLISQEDLEKGLLSLINKGLIPKDADLTPAFNRETNPLQVNVKDIKSLYFNDKLKNDCDLEVLMKLSDNSDSMNSSNLFMTDKYKSSIEINKSFRLSQQELSLNKTTTTKKRITNDKKNYTILIHNNLIVRNDDYNNFRRKCINNWKDIQFLLQKINEVLIKVSIKDAEIDSIKLEKISQKEYKYISNKDFLNTLTDNDLKLKNLFSASEMYETIQKAFAIKIQNWYRTIEAKRKLKKLKDRLNKIIFIQNWYKYSLLKQIIADKLYNYKEKNREDWEVVNESFKYNWKEIINKPRIEIHINSVSSSIIKNTTIDKFKQKENNQLPRLMSLSDPNVMIIYVSSIKLSNEVLSYYFSILQTLGIDDAKDRFFLVIPDMKEEMAISYSVSQLLYISRKSLNIIRNQIFGKTAYIIPGVANKYDTRIAIELGIPILCSDYNLTNVVFSKSGSKRLLGLLEYKTSYSRTDIYSENEFYESLTELFINHPEINIWIFKMNNEFNGRGIAYLDIEKSKMLSDIRGQDIESSQVTAIFRKIISRKVSFVVNRIYSNWADYFNEFITYGGIIEACMSKTFSNIVNSSSTSLFIEPDGHIKRLYDYDNININNFRNIGLISPQISTNRCPNSVIETLGEHLYNHHIIGYITIDFITYIDGIRTIFTPVDIKYGLTDNIVCLNFCSFLYNNSLGCVMIENPDQKEERYNNIIIPYLVHPNFSLIKMKDIVQFFRIDNLIYDIEKKNGIVFNLPDIIQGCMIGILAIGNNFKTACNFIKGSLDLIKLQIQTKENKLHDEFRNDNIDFNEIVESIRIRLKNILNP